MGAGEVENAGGTCSPLPICQSRLREERGRGLDWGRPRLGEMCCGILAGLSCWGSDAKLCPVGGCGSVLGGGVHPVHHFGLRFEDFEADLCFEREGWLAASRERVW